MEKTLRQEIIDNTGAARMSLWVVIQELKNKYTSKKKIKGPIGIVNDSLNKLNELSQKVNDIVEDPLLEFDEEIKWFMKVSEPDTGFTFDEDVTSDVQNLDETFIADRCNKIVEHFNQTLKSYENLRELVEVYKVVTYTKRIKLN